TSAPNTVMSSEGVVVDGLSANTWYRFALKSIGDNADTSTISNTLVAKGAICDGGGGGDLDGDGGGVAGGASLLAGSASDVEVQATPGAENSLFPGAPLDSLQSDRLRFPGEPRLGEGVRCVYVREGSGQGLSLDRAQLLAVDHSPESES